MFQQHCMYNVVAILHVQQIKFFFDNTNFMNSNKGHCPVDIAI